MFVVGASDKLDGMDRDGWDGLGGVKGRWSSCRKWQTKG